MQSGGGGLSYTTDVHSITNALIADKDKMYREGNYADAGTTFWTPVDGLTYNAEKEEFSFGADPVTKLVFEKTAGELFFAGREHINR